MNAFATGQTWDFSTAHTNNNNNGNTLQYSQGGVSLTMTAWASTGTGCATYDAVGTNGVGGNHDANNTNYKDVDSCIESAKLEQITNSNGYLGIGIQNRTETSSNVWPDHGIDNSNKDILDPELEFEMVLLTFSETVSLSSISAGLAYSDSDTSIAAFNMNSTQSFNGSFANHTTWMDIVGNGTNGGWNLISDNTEFPSRNGSSLSVSNSEDVFSRYWLVGALNTALGGERWSDMNDSFKFNGITTVAGTPTGPNTPISVNAPASFGLFALFSILLLRRKS